MTATEYEPDLIVLRGTPPEWGLEGRWLDSRSIPRTVRGAISLPPYLRAYKDDPLRFLPTGDFEVRDSDGAVAEVWRLNG